MRLLDADDDPLLDQRRRDCISKIAQWLRRRDRATVLSITCYGDRSYTGKAADRAYDAVALESDLDRAIERLPLLEKTACLLSKEARRDEQGWFRWVNWELLHAVPNEWVEWQRHVEDTFGQFHRPFEKLLDHAAERIADDLGPGWY